MAWRRSKKDSPSPGSDGAIIEPLTDAERQWLADRLDDLAALGATPGDLQSMARTFDQHLEASWATDEEHRADPNPTLNALGVGIGSYLIGQAGPSASWVIATDPWGTDLAVHQNGGDVLVYPVNVLAKRWAARDAGSVESLVANLSRQMRERRSTG